jgi:hypothetical protein
MPLLLLNWWAFGFFPNAASISSFRNTPFNAAVILRTKSDSIRRNAGGAWSPITSWIGIIPSADSAGAAKGRTQ